MHRQDSNYYTGCCHDKGAMSRVGIALFGFGRAGHIHFLNLIRHHRVQLLYIVDLEANKVEEALREYNQEGVVVLQPERQEQVLDDQRVEAVFICTPTYTHEAIVRASIQHGKAVFCEKPVGEDEAGTLACYEEAEKAGMPLLCSFNRRFDPSLRLVRNRVLAGEVGDVHVIKMCSRDHPLPSMDYLRISGGIFHDCAVHDIDTICWMLGEYPIEVYTQAHAHHKGIAEMGDVDTVAIVMKFPNNVIATIDISRHACYGYDQRIEVYGMGGMLVSENQRPTNVVAHSAAGASLQPILHSFPQRYADSYQAALDHFLNVVSGEETIEITKYNTYKISEIASACERSHKEGKPIAVSVEADRKVRRIENAQEAMN